MSSHASNGRGSVVATIGLFIVVSIGAAVDRSSKVLPAVGVGGLLCQPAVPPKAAAISAATAPIRRTLVSTTPPDASAVPCRECTSRVSTVTEKREHVLILPSKVLAETGLSHRVVRLVGRGSKRMGAKIGAGVAQRGTADAVGGFRPAHRSSR